LDSTVLDNNNDEVAEVAKNYNAMLVELKNLIEEVKNKEIQKRKAEFKALQAQINPHFLTNTLNTR
ncbi:MAG: histidine kinase, partial [Hungateiclostridium thermocellum]|nr:histidine kinase [Acetivibrio thermocellus]